MHWDTGPLCSAAASSAELRGSVPLDAAITGFKARDVAASDAALTADGIPGGGSSECHDNCCWTACSGAECCEAVSQVAASGSVVSTAGVGVAESHVVGQLNVL